MIYFPSKGWDAGFKKKPHKPVLWASLEIFSPLGDTKTAFFKTPIRYDEHPRPLT